MIHEIYRMMHQINRMMHEINMIIHEINRMIHEIYKMIHEIYRVMQGIYRVIHEANSKRYLGLGALKKIISNLHENNKNLNLIEIAKIKKVIKIDFNILGMVFNHSL